MDVVLTVLGLALALAVIAALAAVIAVLLGLRSLKKRNRVSPDLPSEAPLTWMASPASAARLHRRLRSAAAVARMIQVRHAGDPTPPGQVELAARIEQEAVSVDRHLAVVGRLAPTERKRLLRQLGAEVSGIEQVVSRLSVQDARSGATARLPHETSAIADLSDRLDLLEAARQEIDAAEAGSGLHSPSSIDDRTAPPSLEPHRRPRRSRS